MYTHFYRTMIVQFNCSFSPKIPTDRYSKKKEKKKRNIQSIFFFGYFLVFILCFFFNWVCVFFFNLVAISMIQQYCLKSFYSLITCQHLCINHSTDIKGFSKSPAAVVIRTPTQTYLTDREFVNHKKGRQRPLQITTPIIFLHDM